MPRLRGANKPQFLVSLFVGTLIVGAACPVIREDVKYERGAIRNIKPVETPFQISTHCVLAQPHLRGDFLVSLGAKYEFDECRLARRGIERINARTPIGRSLRQRHFVGGSSWTGHVAPRNKQSVEPRTLTEPPPRGMENVPWPTPLSGRGTRHCLSKTNLAVFRETVS
jgi:hypothetical protein